MLTKPDLDKAFKQTVNSLRSMEKALTDPAFVNLASVLSAIGDVKGDPVYECMATSLYSYLSELQKFNIVFSAAPPLKKDLKPKVEETLDQVRKSISTLRKELLKESPNYKSILHAVGNIFFEFHKLIGIRSSYSTG